MECVQRLHCCAQTDFYSYGEEKSVTARKRQTKVWIEKGKHTHTFRSECVGILFPLFCVCVPAKLCFNFVCLYIRS